MLAKTRVAENWDEDCLLVRIDRPRTDHSSEAKGQATDSNDPGAGDHETVDEARLDHLTRSQADDADSEAGVKESIVEI